MPRFFFRASEWMRGEGGIRGGDPQNNFSNLLVIILRRWVIILRWFYCFFQSSITIFHHLKIIWRNILRQGNCLESTSGTFVVNWLDIILGEWSGSIHYSHLHPLQPLGSCRWCIPVARPGARASTNGAPPGFPCTSSSPGDWQREGGFKGVGHKGY